MILSGAPFFLDYYAIKNEDIRTHLNNFLTKATFLSRNNTNKNIIG